MGIPDDYFVNRDKIPDIFVCPRCGLVTDEPVQTACDCLYCATCAPAEGEPCLGCGTEVRRKPIDGGLLKIWWAVRVKCVFHVGGICDWEGPIIDMNVHLKNVQEHFSWTESKIKDYEAKIRELECIVESLRGTVSSTAETSPIRLCRDVSNNEAA